MNFVYKTKTTECSRLGKKVNKMNNKNTNNKELNRNKT